MKLNSRLIVGIATCGPVGKMPFAPGTFGSLPGIALYFLLAGLAPLAQAFCIAGVVLLAVWSAGRAEAALGCQDPGCIVIDEVAGMTVTFFALPFNPYLAVIGFAVFRVFDVWKPFPVGYLDKTLTGGLGIVMDDVAAGIMGNLILHALCYVLPAFVSGR